MATGNSLVTDAIARTANNPSGVSPTTQELADGVVELNRMLGTWSAEMGMIYAETLDSLTWTATNATRTIGVSGDFNVSRPQLIKKAWMRDASGYDYQLEVVAFREYQEETLKAITEAIPRLLAYNPDFASGLGSLFVWPVPTADFTFRLESLKPLAALTGAGTVTLPPGYEDAIVMNLAVRLADVYGTEVSQVTAMLADAAKKALVEGNIQFAYAKMDPLAPGQRNSYNPRAFWNI